MSMYRARLPQLDGGLFLTDGGLETTLVFHEGHELPYFAAFDLLREGWGRAAIQAYYERYLGIARRHGAGFILDSPTWRASADWAAKLGYTREALAMVNAEAIELLAELRARHAGADLPIVISGQIGPRGDGYKADQTMSVAEAEAYHAEQIATFAASAADMVSAMTMTHAEEAIGITLAAKAAGMPVVISFTVETDGRLPSGQSLGDAISETDAATQGGPAYFMLNCAHPAHFEAQLAGGGGWLERLRGLRANASTRSHAELDEATELDAGDPLDLAARYQALRQRLGQLTVLGGCCGTDHRHVDAIAGFCRQQQAA